MAVLEEALDLRSDYPPLRVAIGNLLLDGGDYDAAYGHHRAALQLDPQSTQARFGIAKVLASRDDSEAAIEAFKATLETSPGFGAAHYALGLLYRDQGEVDLAAHHLGQAESYQGQKLAARDVLMGSVAQLAVGAQSLTKQALREHADGRLEQAVALLLEATEKDPAFVPARVNLIKLVNLAVR